MKNPLSCSLAFCIAVVTLFFGFTPGMADVLSDGANRLVDLQADIIGDNAGNGFIDDDPDDGGWDWYLLPSDTAHTSTPSPDNLYGVTANGLIWAFQIEPSFRLAIGLLDTYFGTEANPDIDSGPDFGFLVRLSNLTGDSYYADLSRDRWNTKMAAYGGADSLAMLIRDSRHDQGWDGLIPWDIGLYIESAMELQDYFPGEGFLADAIDMADVIYNDITSETPYFDMDNDSMPVFYLGLEGIVVSFGLTEVYTNFAALAGRTLLNAQDSTGYWTENATLTDPDIQTTAYILMAFGMLDLQYAPVLNAAQAGSNYLASIQEPNGGWDFFGYEYPEVDGECLRAMGYYPPETGLRRLVENNTPSSSNRTVIRPWSD